MARKSERVRASTRISATDASRSFSRVLDRVQRGARVLVHRHGRDVCVIAPPAPPARRASECLEILRARSPVTLDDRFEADLIGVLAGEPVEERPSWDS